MSIHITFPGLETSTCSCKSSRFTKSVKASKTTKSKSASSTKRKDVRVKVKKEQDCGPGGTFVGNGIGCVANSDEFIDALMDAERMKDYGKTRNGTVASTFKPKKSMTMFGSPSETVTQYLAAKAV